jgi:hypothetical protein
MSEEISCKKRGICFLRVELGKAICAHPDDIESALAAYERTLFPAAKLQPIKRFRIISVSLAQMRRIAA